MTRISVLVLKSYIFLIFAEVAARLFMISKSLEVPF